MTTTYTSTVDLVVQLFDLPEIQESFLPPEGCRRELRRIYSQMLMLLGETSASPDTHVLREHLFRLGGLDGKSARHLFMTDHYECPDNELRHVRIDLLERLLYEVNEIQRLSQYRQMLQHGCSIVAVMRFRLIRAFLLYYSQPDRTQRFPGYLSYMKQVYGAPFVEHVATMHAMGLASANSPYNFNDVDALKLWSALRHFGVSGAVAQ